MAAPVLAGALGAPLRVFLAYDLLALTLWGATFTGLGAVFHGNVALVVRSVERLGSWGLVLAASVVAGLTARSVARYVRATRTARESST
jgi:membrane protein DedA with SNARE-associated domain